ncbi:GntR family transcriptional regulator [Ramlibacter alkalitolerans]|uniref:GntR family transcriptional regulator n=1 Tax=Ramlibacter alkalitolerans TaxID=2039631 RepID=UPI002ED2BA6C
MQALPSAAPEAASRLWRERIYEQLRADILNCAVPPGAEIREGELALRFGVSKSPVRDALMHLQREGLVIALPRQGYRVSSVSLADVDDMFHLRAALERACMERIVRNASDERLQGLDRFRRFEAGAWSGGFIEYNRAFHRSLAEVAGNARMRDQLTDLIDQMERVVRVSVASIKQGDPQLVVREHGVMIDALQARDTRKAERLAERHIATAGKRVQQALARLVVPG